MNTMTLFQFALFLKALKLNVYLSWLHEFTLDKTSENVQFGFFYGFYKPNYYF